MAAIDLYANQPSSSSSSSSYQELMKALEPFIRSASPTSTSTTFTSPFSNNSYSYYASALPQDSYYFPVPGIFLLHRAPASHRHLLLAAPASAALLVVRHAGDVPGTGGCCGGTNPPEPCANQPDPGAAPGAAAAAEGPRGVVPRPAGAADEARRRGRSGEAVPRRAPAALGQVGGGDPAAEEPDAAVARHLRLRRGRGARLRPGGLPPPRRRGAPQLPLPPPRRRAPRGPARRLRRRQAHRHLPEPRRVDQAKRRRRSPGLAQGLDVHDHLVGGGRVGALRRLASSRGHSVAAAAAAGAAAPRDGEPGLHGGAVGRVRRLPPRHVPVLGDRLGRHPLVIGAKQMLD